MAKVIEESCFLPSPAPGAGVHAATYYTSAANDLISIHAYISRSDTLDEGYIRFSSDNGQTWTEPQTWPTKFDSPTGTGRLHPRTGFYDPSVDRFIMFWVEGSLPTDNPLEGMKQWKLHYFTSNDGGRTRLFEGQATHEGPSYDAMHHFPGITVGKNCLMMGDTTCCPIRRSDGVILVPCQSSCVGPDGEYHNPGKGYTYTDAIVLLGRWNDDGKSLSWTCSQRIAGAPARSTRGMVEPTLAELPGGKILMVMRGCNNCDRTLPAYKWASLSEDGGMTWTEPQPWTFTDGQNFFSPGACSQLINHSSGRVYWIGNISKENALGNSPRYPLFIGEVDSQTGLLIRDSLTVIDDRREGESEDLTLSNFHVREDRPTGHLLIHLPRFFAHSSRKEGQVDWTTDATLYRIEV